MRRARVQTTLLLLLTALVAGCGRAVVQTDNPIPITAAEYDRVFDATNATLRDFGFVPARQDRRFGVITSRPKLAPSVFEPWRPDNTTAGQVLANTLNHRRRIARVELSRRDPDQREAAPAAEYQLAVVVQLQQRQHPPRLLHSATAASVAHYGRSAGARRVYTAAGVEQSFWRPLGRDRYLERRLIAAILGRTATAAASSPRPEARPHAQTDSNAPENDSPS